MNLASTTMLVILYGKQIDDSLTLKSLLDFDLSETRLTIVNNGPEALDTNSEVLRKLNEKVKLTVLQEYLSNKPLSILYNDFIKSDTDFDNFVILDDDTFVGIEFLSIINHADNNNYDLVIPLIKSESDGRIYYPVENGITVETEKDMDPKGTLSIGSGLVLRRKLISLLLNKYNSVFDENYALYGVDMSLFRRIRELSLTGGEGVEIKCQGMLLHSLSRIGVKPNKFRTTERLIDAAITGRRYFSIKNEIFMLKVFVKSLPVLGFLKSILLLCKYFILGRHDRSTLWKKNQYNHKDI